MDRSVNFGSLQRFRRLPAVRFESVRKMLLGLFAEGRAGFVQKAKRASVNKLKVRGLEDEEQDRIL